MAVNKDLERAKLLLQQDNCTCVLCKNDAVFYGRVRGIRPLVDFLDSGLDFSGFSCADKVVGRAAAYLYCLLGVAAVHAQVMSRDAQKILLQYGICCSCDKLADTIRNRQNTGPCPMEAATVDVQTPEEALCAVRAALQRLQG